MRILTTFLCFLITVAHAAPPPVIWGPNDSVQALTGKGLLVGARLQDDGNYVKNPNAFFDATNVTNSSSTATRSTTTPLGKGGTEWNVTVTAANGTVTWATDPFSEGLKGAQCEARWKYRGFQTTTLFQVRQGANVVSQVAASVSSTSTTQGSLPFPCGDLSTATTFVVTDTATLGGTNEIADIYFGQVQSFSSTQNTEVFAATFSQVMTTTSIAGENFTGVPTVQNSTPAVSISGPTSGTYTLTFNQAGKYQITLNTSHSHGGTYSSAFRIIKSWGGTATIGGSQAGTSANQLAWGIAAETASNSASETITVTPTVGQTVTLGIQTDHQALGGTASQHSSFASLNIVGVTGQQNAVSPGSQNVYGVRKWDGNQSNVSRATNAYLAFNGASLASNVTNLGTATACASANDLCAKIPNLPVGDYAVSATATFQTGGAAATACAFGIGASNDASNLITTTEVNQQLTSELQYSPTISGVYSNTSVNDREFYVLGNRLSGGTCDVLGGNSARRITISVTPINRTPQPVFIQSPVRAAEDGVPLGVGFLGQKIEATQASLTSIGGASLDYRDILSVALTKGSWEISGMLTFNANAGVNSTVQLSISETGGNIGTGSVSGVTQSEGAGPTGSFNSTLIVSPMIFEVTTASKTYFLKARSQWTGAAPSAAGRLFARRIN
jgi:hypothetical protein